LSQGLSQIAEVGRMWGVAKAALGSFTVVQKANNLATQAAGAVQKLFTGAVDQTSTGFTKLKGAIIATGFGILVVLIGAIISNFQKIKETVLNLVPGLAKVGEIIGNIFDAVTDWIGVTSDATRQADALKESIVKQNEAAENSIKLLEASGASSKEVRALKNAMYEDELNNLRKVLSLQGNLSEDESKRFKELKFNQALIVAEQSKEIKDKAEADKKAAEDATKKAGEAAKQKGEKIASQNKANHEKEIEAERKKDEEIFKQYEADTQKAIDALRDKNSFELELLQAQGANVIGIRSAQIDGEIELLKNSGGKFAEGIQKLEQEKVLIAAQAKTDALAVQKEIDDKAAEDQKAIADELAQEADALRIEGEETDLLRLQEKYDAMRAIVGDNEELLTAITGAENQARANVIKKWDDITLQQKRDNINALGSLLGGASALIGKNTAVGKGLAIAEATVQTYLGATKALSASSGIPIVGTALGIANAALIVANGIKSVSTIVKTKVPGASDGGGSIPTANISGASSSPAMSSAPTMDGIQSTLLDQTKRLSEGKDSLKAYVVESEITQKQERQRAITQTANF
ncbi:MAG: hypothetical protein ABIN67_13770, partial [Ferruginibacter sp.]